MTKLVDTRISNTPIGQLFQWDHLNEVELDVLESAVTASRNILREPSRYPQADLDTCRWKLEQIDAFLRTYGDRLAELVV